MILPDVCNIYTHTYTDPDGIGVARRSLTLLAEDVPCFQQPMGQREAYVFAQRGQRVDFKIYMEPLDGIAVDENCTIVVTSLRGAAVPEAAQTRLDVKTAATPDATIGFGIYARYNVGFQSNDAEVVP